MGRKRMTDAEKAESARIRKARSRAKQQEPTQSGYLPNTSQVQPEHSSPLQSSPPPLILSASPETSNSRQQSQVLCDRGLESEFEKLNIIEPSRPGLSSASAGDPITTASIPVIHQVSPPLYSRAHSTIPTPSLLEISAVPGTLLNRRQESPSTVIVGGEESINTDNRNKAELENLDDHFIARSDKGKDTASIYFKGETYGSTSHHSNSAAIFTDDPLDSEDYASIRELTSEERYGFITTNGPGRLYPRSGTTARNKSPYSPSLRSADQLHRRSETLYKSRRKAIIDDSEEEEQTPDDTAVEEVSKAEADGNQAPETTGNSITSPISISSQSRSSIGAISIATVDALSPIAGATSPRRSASVSSDPTNRVSSHDSENLDIDAHAESVLSSAWSSSCSCVNKPSNTKLSKISLQQLAQEWENRYQPFCSSPLLNPDLITLDLQNEPRIKLLWHHLLGGGSEGPRFLDFATSEQNFLRRLSQPNIKILRRWDIDSVIARVQTLAIHRGGFNLSYRPSFMRRITQSQRVTINGRELHRVGQLRLGQGALAAGYNYNTHVFFPRLTIQDGGETHLTDADQHIWLDRIIIPALIASCPNDSRQHYPRSFDDAKCKSQVKEEINMEGKGYRDMDIYYHVQESYLDAFTQELQRLAASSDLSDKFGDLFFVISGHNLKLATKRNTAWRCRHDFLQHLNQVFNTDLPGGFSEAESWIDTGLEDTPTCEDDNAVVLLRKTQCLAHWTGLFQCPSSRRASGFTRESYTWGGTSDAGSASVKLAPDNALRSQGGIVYNKAYNLHKDLFSTPQKSNAIFENHHFEGLGYTQDLLERWYRINSFKGYHISGTWRTQTVAQFVKAKRRAYTALRDSCGISYGIRQEYRIALQRFKALGFPNSQPDDLPESEIISKLTAVDLDENASSDSHRPYWVLSTAEVNRFLAAQLNRWLLCAEFLISRAQHHPGLSTVIASSEAEQMSNGVLISACLRLLRLCTGSIATVSNPGLFSNCWISKRNDQQSASSSDSTRARRQQRWGLRLRDCLRDHGTVWLPGDLMLWSGPSFTPKALRHLDLARLHMGGLSKQSAKVRAQLQHSDVMLSQFRELCEDLHLNPNDALEFVAKFKNIHFRIAVIRVFKAMAEVILSCYIRHILGILASRASDNPKRTTWQQDANFKDFTASMEPEEAGGLHGLSWSLVARLLHGEPNIALARRGRKDGQGRNGRAYFMKYDTGLWQDKVWALFDWDDPPVVGRRPRGWENADFRMLTRTLHAIVVQTCGPDVARRFVNMTKWHIATKLWIIPQYDTDKVSVMMKPSKHNAKSTQDYIKDMGPLQRTNWVVPQLRPEFHAGLRALESDGTSRYADLSDPKRRIKKVLQEMDSVAVLTDHKTQLFGIPKQPEKLGLDLRLHDCIRFNVDLEAAIETIESSAESEDESENDSS